MVWFDEFLIFMAYSKRTQFAIWMGMISFVVILALGEHLVSNLNLQGLLAPLTAVMREALLDRYDKAAWSSLGGFLLLAIKFYRKDRKILLSM